MDINAQFNVMLEAANKLIGKDVLKNVTKLDPIVGINANKSVIMEKIVKNSHAKPK